MYSKICLQLIPLSQGNFFLMIGSLEVTHELIFAIPSVIEISSINSVRLRINLGKPQLEHIISGCHNTSSRAVPQQVQSSSRPALPRHIKTLQKICSIELRESSIASFA